jgi:hypothetical protein
MAKRGKKIIPRSPDVDRLEKIIDKLAGGLTDKIAKVEFERDLALRELNALKERLVGLLVPDQLEAARVCCVPPEQYALEVIDLWKFRTFPTFVPEIKHLGALQAGKGVYE